MLSRCSRALSASVKIGLVRSNIGRFLLMHPYRPNRFLRQVYNCRQAMLRPLLLASVFALAAPAGAQEVIDDMAPPVREGVAAPGDQDQTAPNPPPGTVPTGAEDGTTTPAEGRAGKECVRTWSSRCSLSH